MKILLYFVSLSFFCTTIYGQKSFGFSYQTETKKCVITNVFKNSPAAKAGIKVGDIIISIKNDDYLDDYSELDGLSLEATAKIFKDAAEVCLVNLQRNGKLIEDVAITKVETNTFLNICLSGNCKNGKGEFVEANGTYNGTFKNGQYAVGKMTYSSGPQYTGNWVNNKPHGKGNVVFTNGNIYEGDFADGEPNGIGTYTFKNGVTHTGFYKAGKPNGIITQVNKGEVTKVEYRDGKKVEAEKTPTNDESVAKYKTINYKNGDEYIGYILNNKREGKGKYKFQNGSIYEGDWKNNLYEGQGILIINDGVSSYSGSFRANKFEGTGTYKFLNGNIYVGEWKNDLREGYGILTYANGTKLEGEWVADQIKNKNVAATPSDAKYETFTYTDGAKYEGYTLNGKPEGKGKYIHPSGNVYEGNWKNGLKDGQGILTLNDGNSYNGGFKADKYEGKGTYRFKNGDYYEGDWENGKYNGNGRKTLITGAYFDGEFVDGKFEKKGKYVNINGDYYEGEWKDGKYNGKGKEYFKQTNSFKEGIYVDGVLTQQSTQQPSQKRMYGFINPKGQVVIALKYEKVDDFNEGYAVVLNSNKQLLIIDKKGTEVPVKNAGYDISFSFNSPFVFSEGLCAVIKNKKIGFINTKGEEVIPCEYETPLVPKDADSRTVKDLPKFINGVAVVYKNGLYGVIDKAGKIIVPIEHNFITHFKHNLAVFKKDTTTIAMKGVIDKSGKVIIKPSRGNNNIWIEGANIIRLHYKEGQYTNFYVVYDSKGEEVGKVVEKDIYTVSNHYKYLSEFKNGFALYGDKEAPNYWGVIDSMGKKIPFTEKYRFNSNEPSQFQNGYLFAQKSDDNKMVVLNNKGERVNKNCEYDYIHELNRDGIAYGARGGGKASFFDDKNCKLIYETTIDGNDRMSYFFSSLTGIYPFKGDYAIIDKDYGDFIKQEKEFIIIDKNGKTTYSVKGGGGCNLSPDKTELGIFQYSQRDLYDLKKPQFDLYLKGDGTVLYKSWDGKDFNDGLAAVKN